MTTTTQPARLRRLQIALFAGAAATFAASAAAADTTTSTADATTAAQVPELIVTAQKRVENVQAVPASVTAIDTKAFDATGITRFEDYAAQIPGLAIVSFKEGQAQLTLRGITTGVAQSAAATSIYVDEAPVGSVNAYAAGTSLTPDLDPSDLSQIEVLKGPQGTLYGAGAMGGLIKFVTTPLDYSHFSGRVSAGADAVAGGGDGYAFRGLVNLPVSDQLAFRVSGFDREDPGFVDNVTGQTNANVSDLWGVHAEAGWKPSDHFSVVLSALGQATHDNDSAIEFVNGVTLKPVYGDLKYQAFIPQPSDTRMWVYNGTVRGDVAGFDLVSSTTYETIRSHGIGDGSLSYGAFLGATFGIPNFGIEETLVDNTDRFVQELRASSKLFDGKLDYQFGVYYATEGDYLAIPGFFPFNTLTKATIPFPNIVTASITTRYSEYAGYANATYHFTDRLDLLAGVRYAVDDQIYGQDYAGLLVGPEIKTHATSSNDVTTWLVSPSYKITDDLMVYFRAANGYRPGGPNALPPAVINAPATFAPDTLVSYELGVKSQFLDRRVTLNAAAFVTDWNDIQIQTSQAGFNFYVNGGSARVRGGEVSLLAVPVQGLTLNANAAYTDARLSTPAPFAGGLKGDELPFVPQWAGALGATYRHPVAGNLTGVVGGQLSYTGDRISDFSQRAAVRVPSFSKVNLNAGVEYDQWSLSLYLNNVGNARGITYLKSEGLTPSSEPFGAGLIQPRTFGVELAARF